MNKTVPVAGMLGTTDPSDTYPLLDDASLWGGFRIVANAAVREGIPIDRRKLRMEVKEIDSGKTYELIGGLENAFWIEKVSGSSELATHINDKNNPHDTTKEQVGLGKVDNTSDIDKPISTATQVALDLKEDKLNKNKPNGYAGLGDDGKVISTLLPSYIDDIVEYPNKAAFPLVGVSSIIYVDMSTPFPQKQYRWSGSTYVEITSGAVTSVNGKTGAVSLVKSDIGLSLADNTSDISKSVLSATKLTTPRTINGIPFDGTQNIVLPIPTFVDEVFIGRLQPTATSIKIWIKHEVKDDLYYLRQIRDANPTSQLPALWLDSEDPYTHWEGVQWQTWQGQLRCDALNLGGLKVVDLSKVTGLSRITQIYCDFHNDELRYINVTGLSRLYALRLPNNKLASIPSIVSKGLLTDFDVTHNLMPPTETNRLRALGFTDAQLLPQDI